MRGVGGVARIGRVRSGLQHFLDALERRWRFTLWVDLYLETAFVTSVLLAAVLLGGRLLFGAPAALSQGPILAAVVVGIVVFGSAVAATLVVWTCGDLRERVASEADRVMRLDARLVTATELVDAPAVTRVGTLLLRDASQRVEGRLASDVFPLPPLAYRWATALALLAIAMAVLAPPGLTWTTVKRNPLALVGVPDEKPPAPFADGEKPPPPDVDFIGFPLKGKAPLDVRFIDQSRGEITSRKWDFSDIGGASSIQPRHTFLKPGKYTITLEATGPGGTGVARKIEYVEVLGDEGGGEDPRVIGLGRPYAKRSPAASPKLGPSQARPREIQKVPVGVDALSREGDTVKKTKNVFDPGAGADPSEPPPPFEQIYPQYRRVAEEAIGREHIPPSLREFVKVYFDAIAPK